MRQNLLQKKQKNKKLIIIICILGLITAYNFGRGYLKNLGFSMPEFIPPLDISQMQRNNIDINFSALNNFKNVHLDDYDELEVEILSPSRKNPYIPY